MPPNPTQPSLGPSVSAHQGDPTAGIQNGSRPHQPVPFLPNSLLASPWPIQSLGPPGQGGDRGAPFPSSELQVKVGSPLALACGEPLCYAGSCHLSLGPLGTRTLLPQSPSQLQGPQRHSCSIDTSPSSSLPVQVPLLRGSDQPAPGDLHLLRRVTCPGDPFPERTPQVLQNRAPGLCLPAT